MSTILIHYDLTRSHTTQLHVHLPHCLSSGDNTEGADKSLAQPTSRCILFDGENISFDAGLVIYI